MGEPDPVVLFIGLCFPFPFSSWTLVTAFSSFLPDLFSSSFRTWLLFALESNSYSITCCLSWLLHFTAFLERPSHWLVAHLRLGHVLCWWQSPLCCVLLYPGPAPSLSEAAGGGSVSLACRWGQKPTETGSARLQAGRGNCLPTAAEAVSLVFLVVCLLLSLCLPSALSFFLSADFCFLPLACPTPSPRLSPSLA